MVVSFTGLPPFSRAYFGPRPGVEDEPRVAAEQHHDVRGRVRADAREREQRVREVVVGQLVAACAAERLEIERSRSDVGRAASGGRRRGSPARTTSR